VLHEARPAGFLEDLDEHEREQHLGKNSVKKSDHLSVSTSSGAGSERTLPTSTMTASSPKSAAKYQPMPTRHLRHRPSRSRTPALPLVAAVTRKAGSATPRIDASEVTASKATPSVRSTGKVSSPRAWRTTGRKTLHAMA
jgi:hypothetical protein